MNISQSDRAPVSRDVNLPVVVTTPDSQDLFVPLLNELSRIDNGARERRAELRDEQDREALADADASGIAAATHTLQQREAAALRGDALEQARRDATQRAHGAQQPTPDEARDACTPRRDCDTTPQETAPSDDADRAASAPKPPVRTPPDPGTGEHHPPLRASAARAEAPAGESRAPALMPRPIASEHAAQAPATAPSQAGGVPAAAMAGAATAAGVSAAPPAGVAATSTVGSTGAAPAGSPASAERSEAQPGLGSAAPSASARPSSLTNRAAPDLRGSSAETASFERLLRAVRGRLKESRSTMTMRLDPPTLGSIRVSMSVDRGRVSLDVATETQLAHRMLTSEVESLRRSLEAVGARLDEFVVRSPDPQDAGASHGAQHAQADTSGHGRPNADAEHSRSPQETDLRTAGATDGASTESFLAWTTESSVNVLA